jgi:hypothetical protein
MNKKFSLARDVLAVRLSNVILRIATKEYRDNLTKLIVVGMVTLDSYDPETRSLNLEHLSNTLLDEGTNTPIKFNLSKDDTSVMKSPGGYL